MTEAQLDKVRNFIADNIGKFHAGVLAKVRDPKNINLDILLSRFNPYLYKAKALENAHEFVKRLLEDKLRRSEGTQFGQLLENIAVFVGGMLYDGRKSAGKSVDLEFTRDGKHFVVSVKSGPNWGNRSQHASMESDFRTAKKIAGQGGMGGDKIFVVGSCYGRKGNQNQASHIRYCGQEFWRFLSGDDDLYLKIIEPLGHQAAKRNDEFNTAYDQLLNKLTQEFANRFCVDGRIQWERLVEFNSAREKPRRPRASKPPRRPKQARKKG